jgi:hypothetical protein
MMKKLWLPDECDEMTLNILTDWMRRNEESLAPHQAQVPKTWRRNAIKNLYFPRQCFARAIQFVRRSPRLPQAEYFIGQAACGGCQQHGWVEIEGIVFDGVMQDFYTKQGYYASQKVKPWYRFSREATLWIDPLSKKHCDWSYRWDCVLDLPWSRYVDLPLIDLEDAKRYWEEKQQRSNNNARPRPAKGKRQSRSGTGG